MKKTAATPRSIAIDILCEWQVTRQSIDQIKQQMACSLPDPRDNQLTAALVFGVLRQLGHLDWLLAHFSSHPLAKMKPLTLNALRVGLYQLLYMDRVPHSAAINETVKVIKRHRQPKWLSGFVNGLLRNVCRKLESSSLPLDIPLYARLSHPEWLIARWQERWGEEATEQLCLHNNTPAQLCLAANSKRTSRQELQSMLDKYDILTTAGIFAPDALVLPNFRGDVTSLPGFKEGLFQVQDEMAQLVVYLFDPFKEGRYLDGCAGLGGKTALLAQKLTEKSSIDAVEPQEGRSALLSENLARLGCSKQVKQFAGSIASFAKQTETLFNGVLIDAPCSGTGVIRRHPDIRWNRSPADLKKFQKKQLKIMKKAAELTAPGGTLVYATCSMEPEENENVIDLFLEKQPTFKVQDARQYLPAEAQKLVNSRGFLQSTSEPNCSDGFFGARLKNSE